MKSLIASLAVFVFLLPANIGARVFYNETLDNYADKNSASTQGPWQGVDHSRITLESGPVAYGGSGKCWRYNCVEGGTAVMRLPLASFNLSKVYVRFYYKNVPAVSNPTGKNSKVLRLNGIRNGDSYSNFTIVSGYAGIGAVVTGSGDGLANDCTCAYNYSRNTAGCLRDGVIDTHSPGLSGGLPVMDGNWHCIEAFFKYNTTTGGVNNSDGAFSLWLDGTKIYSVTGIIMRHPQNSMYFTDASFGEYAHRDYLGFYEYYDNIVIADEYIGPVDAPRDITPPAAPMGIRIEVN